MGQQLTTFLLLAVTLATGTLSSIAAHYSHEKNWSKCKIFASISAALALFAVLLSIFIMISIHSHPVRGAASSTESLLTPGLTISFILLILALLVVGVLNIFGAVNAKDGASGSEKLNVWAAVTSAVSFFLCCLIIIFLL